MVSLLFIGVLAALASSFFTGRLVPALIARGVGQPIHEDRRDHEHKAGTPTMGGLAIVAAIVVAYSAAILFTDVPSTATCWLVIGLMVAAAGVGFADDLVKVRSKKNAGLSVKVKFGALSVIGIGFALSVVALSPAGRPPIIQFGTVVVVGSPVLVTVWILGLVVATSNAVNLTDGMDGLAAGAATLSFAAMAVIAVAIGPFVGYGFSGGTPVAALAVTFAGAAAGFLRFNAHPAKVFMGDTGSLALGAGLAGIAAITGTGIFLPIVGLLFVVEAGSVIVLVGAFRGFGKRPFHAPIHHEFQKGGMAEPTLVQRLWGLAAVGAVAAVTAFHVMLPQ